MKQLFFSIAVLSITLASCSKTNPSTPKQLANTVNIGGKDYKTVVIGNQTWTTANYDGPTGITDPGLDESIYGKFYTIAESQAITLPSGWRVPTQADFIALMKTQGAVNVDSKGKELLSATVAHLRSSSIDWFTSVPGDNKSGFNAQPGGFGYVQNNYFLNQGGTAYFLSSTPNAAHANANLFLVIDGAITPGGIEDDAYIDPTYYITNGSFTLRFVKDN
jgi:uncharacterized protein (TIGR02145 family)